MSKAVLLVNLGSPDSPSVTDVRRYLNEFLMDGRVIDTPWLLRRFVVGMILIKRPAESGHAYEKIWTKDGSPLVAFTNANFITGTLLCQPDLFPSHFDRGPLQNIAVASLPCFIAGRVIPNTIIDPNVCEPELTGFILKGREHVGLPVFEE